MHSATGVGKTLTTGLGKVLGVEFESPFFAPSSLLACRKGWCSGQADGCQWVHIHPQAPLRFRWEGPVRVYLSLRLSPYLLACSLFVSLYSFCVLSSSVSTRTRAFFHLTLFVAVAPFFKSVCSDELGPILFYSVELPDETLVQSGLGMLELVSPIRLVCSVFRVPCSVFRDVPPKVSMCHYVDG